MVNLKQYNPWQFQRLLLDWSKTGGSSLPKPTTSTDLPSQPPISTVQVFYGDDDDEEEEAEEDEEETFKIHSSGLPMQNMVYIWLCEDVFQSKAKQFFKHCSLDEMWLKLFKEGAQRRSQRGQR